MTDKQLKIEKNKLRDEGHYVTRKCDCTPEQFKRARELSCIDTINSILAYEYSNDAQRVLEREKTSYHKYLEDYIKDLGEERVVELIQGQIDDIVCINYCVYTDSEGLSYNSIVWRDEQ